MCSPRKCAADRPRLALVNLCGCCLAPIHGRVTRRSAREPARNQSVCPHPAPIRLKIRHGKVLEQSDNRLRIRVDSHKFSLTANGFDKKRDLVLRVEVEQS